MLWINSSSRLHRPTQQHYNPKKVFHGAGVLLAGLQTRGALTARPVPWEECLPLGYTKLGESLHSSPESRDSRERGEKSWLRSPAQSADCGGGLLVCEVGSGGGVLLTWLPVWRSRQDSPPGWSVLPQVKAQQRFSLVRFRGEVDAVQR